jgi:hypothetical protein
METLRAALGEGWQDVDAAEHSLAIALGLVPPGSSLTGYRWLYRTANPVGAALHDCLIALVRAGVLRERDGDTAVRWSPEFRAPDGG